MEELLNNLISKGWKPFGMKSTFDYVDILCNQPYRFKHLNSRFWASLRELVSIDSDLRQFVCENRLWKDIDEEKFWHKKTPKMSELRTYDYHFEEYRLIESALCDEDKLEQFLLDNINVDAI